LATLGRPEAYLLAALIGFDAFIFVPLRDSQTRAAFWQRIRQGWRGVAAYSLLAGSYPLTCLLMDGYALPNTFRAKSKLGQEWPDLPRAYFWTPLKDQGWLLVILAGIGVAYLLWRSRKRGSDGLAWALWPTLFVLAVLFMGAQRFVVNHGRYVAPAIPFHALAAAVGVWAVSATVERRLFAGLSLLRRGINFPARPEMSTKVNGMASRWSLVHFSGLGKTIRRMNSTAIEAAAAQEPAADSPPGLLSTLERERQKGLNPSPVSPSHAWGEDGGRVAQSALQHLATRYLIPVGLSAILAATVLLRGYDNGSQVANDVYQLRQMHVKAGDWFKGAVAPGQVIALNDVGAIAHISNRDVLDLEGLVSPEVITATAGTDDYTCPHDLQLARLMLKAPPTLIGVFPWF
jgi:hypothetical protein